jgi:hypothetical protein
MKISSLPVSVVVLFLSSVGSYAQQDSCGAILNGIYDYTSLDVDLDTSRAFRAWACSSSSSSSGMTLDAAISDALLGFGSEREAMRDACREETEQGQLRFVQSESFRRVNEAVAQIWGECMGRPGLNSSLILGSDPHNFTIGLRFISNSNAGFAELNPRDRGFNIQGQAECPVSWLNEEPRRITASGDFIACTRDDPFEEVRVTVTADHQVVGAGGLLVVPAMRRTPEPPLPPTAGDRVIAALANGARCVVQYDSTGRGTINGQAAYQLQWNNVAGGWWVYGQRGARNENQEATYQPRNASEGPGSRFFNHWGVTFRISDDASVEAIDSPVVRGQLSC